MKPPTAPLILAWRLLASAHLGDLASALAASAPNLPPLLPPRVEVAIIGGGMCGLATCAALRSRGVPAHVFEAAPRVLRPSTGTGIMVSPNGMAALGAADARLPDAVRRAGARIGRQRITVTDPGGVETKEIAFDMKDEQVNIAWSEAQGALAEIVPEEAVHCGARFESYAQVDDGVEITFADGRRVRTSLLVGADGAGSAVRQFMAHEKTKNEKRADASYATRYNGQLLWNAIVPSADIKPPAHAPGEVEYTICGTDGQVVLTFDAGGGQTSWYLTLMENHVQSSPDTREIRAALDDNSFGGFGRPGVRPSLERAFAAWPRALACLAATPDSDIFERRLSERPPLRAREWVDAGGRAVLIGDAAHPMVPSQGQGTMMCWEDAADLAACVAPRLRKGKDVGGAVRAFAKWRAGRCAVVQRYSAETYMGRQNSNFFPRKVVRMLGNQRTMKYIKNGYIPLESLDKGGFRKRLARLWQRN